MSNEIKLDSVEGVIAFPNICASLGGASLVRYSARIARVTLASGEIVKIPRRKLGHVTSWTSFNLADAAKGAN